MILFIKFWINQKNGKDRYLFGPYSLICKDYADDFANLNDRIDGLESQIAGFSELSTGLGALDLKIECLSTIVDVILDNAGFSSSIGDSGLD